MIATVIFITLMAFCVFMIAKNGNTYRCHMLITEAIGLYHLDKIAKREFDYEADVDYDDEEPYDKTLWRLWDWGYTRILPPEKFEFIKPYIVKLKDAKNG